MQRGWVGCPAQIARHRSRPMRGTHLSGRLAAPACSAACYNAACSTGSHCPSRMTPRPRHQAPAQLHSAQLDAAATACHQAACRTYVYSPRRAQRRRSTSACTGGAAFRGWRSAPNGDGHARNEGSTTAETTCQCAPASPNTCTECVHNASHELQARAYTGEKLTVKVTLTWCCLHVSELGRSWQRQGQRTTRMQRGRGPNAGLYNHAPMVATSTAVAALASSRRRALDTSWKHSMESPSCTGGAEGGG